MSEYTIQERISRARSAEGYRTDPVIKEAQEKAKQEAIDNWLAAPDFDEKKARIVWATAKAMEVLDEQLRRIINDGVIAAESKR